MAAAELDVRAIARAHKHATIFDTFHALEQGDSFILVNDHDPVPLRQQFDREYPRGYGWNYLSRGPEWRIQISKLSATAMPQVLLNTQEQAAAGAEPDVFGAAWKLEVADRDLDSNLISLAPASEVAAHAGPDLDVLLHITAGSGELETELDTISLAPGAVIWLPKRSSRAFKAGPKGLQYLTVHQHKTGLQIQSVAR